MPCSYVVESSPSCVSNSESDGGLHPVSFLLVCGFLVWLILKALD